MEFGVANKATDYDVTDKNIISELERKRTLIHYIDAYDRCVATNGRLLSPKTDPVEKLRQRYGEARLHDAISFHGGGWLGLRRWFEPVNATNVQPSLIPAHGVYSIDNDFIAGDPIISFDIGYEFAQREPHMKDHYGDRGGKARHERARRGYLVEAHISKDFQVSFPDYWMPPENEGEFSKSCAHDFQVLIKWAERPLTRHFVDVKSLSHFEGGCSFQTRNEKHNHIYIVGDYDDDNRGVSISGFLRGKKQDGVNWYGLEKLHHIEVLYVILSMQHAYLNDGYGMPYGEAANAMRK